MRESSARLFIKVNLSESHQTTQQKALGPRKHGVHFKPECIELLIMITLSSRYYPLNREAKTLQDKRKLEQFMGIKAAFQNITEKIL